MVPIMAATHNDLADIESRNNLRAEAQLPLLDVTAELARLKTARDQAAFEEFFEKNRHRFVHLWEGHCGFTRMAISNAVRKQLREEMRKGRIR
jgi:hypothetical protein